MRTLRFNHVDLLRYAGLFTYACVGIPLLVLETLDGQLPTLTGDSLGWAASYIIFGLSYWELTHDLGSDVGTTRRRLLLLLMCEAAVAISYFSESGLASVLLLVIAGVLPWTLPVRWGIAALIMETVALVPVFSQRVEGYGWFEAMLQCGLYFGFSSFTFVTSLVAKGQSEAREEQRRLISELRATRALLAESTRMNERVRISRELHDLLGHHLTALALNLEVATHLVQGPAQEHVRKAQSVAKLLLSDVREAVSQLREGDEIDLEQALSTLAVSVPVPSIHVEVPPRFGSEDQRRAQVLLRCAQEIITNSIRHAKARNLWLNFERGADNALRMRAHDDGQGTDQLQQGNGLTGMRERLAQLGGGLTIETGKGKGFALEAWLPKEMPS